MSSRTTFAVMMFFVFSAFAYADGRCRPFRQRGCFHQIPICVRSGIKPMFTKDTPDEKSSTSNAKFILFSVRY
jgi:hypothetical protein